MFCILWKMCSSASWRIASQEEVTCFSLEFVDRTDKICKCDQFHLNGLKIVV